MDLTNTLFGPCRAHERLVFESAKGEGEVIEEEYCIVASAAYRVPEHRQAQQDRGMQDHLLRRVEKIFVQDDNIINDFPAVEQARRVWRHQQIDARPRVALAQRAQRWRGEQEITDACELNDQDMGLVR